MNKENKKLAQQQRAQERERRAKQEKTSEILKIVVPTVIIIALVIWVIVDYVNQGSSTDSVTDTETTTEAVSEETDTTEADDDTLVVDEEDEAEDTLYTGTDIAVADGDTVNIAYVGTIDGVAFDGGTSDGADLTIGSGMYIDDFEEQLIGHYVGETVDVNVTFPEDYGVDDLNGQDALFEVTINGIYQSAE